MYSLSCKSPPNYFINIYYSILFKILYKKTKCHNKLKLSSRWNKKGVSEMVEFLETINGKDFSYEKGKKYVSMDDLTEDELKNKVFVRQPNSPKNKNWWTKFNKSDNGIVFRIVDNTEMPLVEMIEENKLLQL